MVDDEDSIRHMLTLVLKKGGYKVKAVGDGEAALKELLAHRYDMVLCDLRMPKMSGHDLLREVRARELGVTMIMMSAYGDIDTALEAIKQGAYDYIPKPFRKDEVLLTLHKAQEREQLRKENAQLKQERRQAFSFDNIIAQSPAMQRVFHTVRKVAAYKTTVLLGGESGTGKELVARAIHFNSDRADGPWVPINCGAIPGTLLESELFGHRKGAFTDATKDKDGLFHKANGGTLFLDEVAELPLALQVKLLRVLQENTVRRIGDTKAVPVDVRIIAATARDLDTMVAEGTFREDLYYRLNVLKLKLPPLRERPEDVALLVRHFVQRHNTKLDTEVRDVTPDALKRLTGYHWPGNVRELENAMEVAIVMCNGDLIDIDDLPARIAQADTALKRVLIDDSLSIKKATRELERILIERALRKTGGNRTRASELLELSHRALLYKIKEYNLQDVR